MTAPHLPDDLPEEIAANREDLRRRSRAERVRPLWLWIGGLTGLVAFVAVRLASIVLLSHGCGQAAGTRLLGLSLPQLVTAGITVLAILLTIGAGSLSWRIWRQTSLPEDEVSTGNMPGVAFWALGGTLLSAFCVFATLYTAGVALVLSGGCP